MTTEGKTTVLVDSSRVREDVQGFDQGVKCPDHPGGSVETGFGLAGGGFGPYTYCNECGRVLTKANDMEEF